MTKDAQIERNLSVTYINKLRCHESFDGKMGRPSPCIVKDTNPASMGLRLRLNKGGKMSFFIKGRIKDQVKLYSQSTFYIGCARHMDLKTARKIAGEYREQLENGHNPKNCKGGGKVFVTLNSLLNEYVNRRRIKDKTEKSYRYRIGKLSPKITEMRIEQLTYNQLLLEHKRIGAKIGYIADQAIKLVGILIKFAQNNYFDPITKASIVKNNPVSLFCVNSDWFVNGGKSRRKRECIDTSHLPMLLNAIDALKDYKDGVKHKHTTSQNAVMASHFFKFLLFTGWRPEEVVKIKWEQVSETLDDVTWDDKKAAASLKNAVEQYRVPLNTYARDVLISLKSLALSSEYVFPSADLKTHFKQNPTDYVDVLEKLVNNNHRYTAGIYRKAFQTYASNCHVQYWTSKRLVFHTQAGDDVHSGYIASEREVLRADSQTIGDYIMKHSGRPIANKLDNSPQHSADESTSLLSIDLTFKNSEKINAIWALAVNKASCIDKEPSEVFERWLKIGMGLDSSSIDPKTTVKQYLAAL